MPTPILVLHNEPLLPRDHPEAESEHSVVEVAGRVAEILERAGYAPSLLGLKKEPQVLWREIQERRPALIFNLFEGSLDEYEAESYVAGLLEWSGVPFTGSPPRTLSLARCKDLTKHLLLGAGLPTAAFFTVSEPPVPPCRLEWPVIVKPAHQDASVGLDQASVVSSQNQLESRVVQLLESYGPPVLVEEFIRGREINVALVEFSNLTPLPPSEIHFPAETPDYWPILTYEAKWKPGTDEHDLTPPEYPAKLSPRLARRLQDLAAKAYRLLGCRDYARVDFRVKPSGKPYILEVNPNPEIHEQAGFAKCLAVSGMDYAAFIRRLVENVIARRSSGRQKMPEIVPV